MGDVYYAEHTTIAKPVAVKVLSPELAHRQDIRHRFLREARAASKLRHENVVDVLDYGETPNGSVFIAMEYLEGEDLGDTLEREGPLRWTRVQPIILQICRALHEAHQNGIVHRDMKPSNCYRTKRHRNEDFIKVVDFGIAKIMGDGGTAEGLTQTGTILGTPAYMSPEQARGRTIDHRADVYSVGIMMYELLTGRVPFDGDSFMGILTSHLLDPVPPPRTVNPAADIGPELEQIITKALAKDPEQRFASIQELAMAIIQLPGQTTRTRVTEHAPAHPVPSGAQNKAKLYLGIAVGMSVVALVAGGVAVFAVLGSDDDVASEAIGAGEAVSAGEPAAEAQAEPQSLARDLSSPGVGSETAPAPVDLSGEQPAAAPPESADPVEERAVEDAAQEPIEEAEEDDDLVIEEEPDDAASVGQAPRPKKELPNQPNWKSGEDAIERAASKCGKLGITLKIPITVSRKGRTIAGPFSGSSSSSGPCIKKAVERYRYRESKKGGKSELRLEL